MERALSCREIASADQSQRSQYVPHLLDERPFIAIRHGIDLIRQRSCCVIPAVLTEQVGGNPYIGVVSYWT